MFRRNLVRLARIALLLALTALLLGGPGVAASAERGSELLRIEVAVRPEGLIEPGDVMLNFIVENVSEEDARNVYLSASDGLASELVGQIAAGETQSFSRQHSVTAQELEAGEILYILSHDDPADANVKVNYTVRAQIRLSDAQPAVEFTRQFSSRSVEQGGTVTVIYRVRNAGNVPLNDVQVRDELGNFSGRVEVLGVGESRALISRVTVDESATSAAELRYRVEGSDEEYVQTLADAAITLAGADLQGVFTVGSVMVVRLMSVRLSPVASASTRPRKLPNESCTCRSLRTTFPVLRMWC